MTEVANYIIPEYFGWNDAALPDARLLQVMTLDALRPRTLDDGYGDYGELYT